jgi:hypothetical protein
MAVNKHFSTCLKLLYKAMEQDEDAHAIFTLLL